MNFHDLIAPVCYAVLGAASYLCGYFNGRRFERNMGADEIEIARIEGETKGIRETTAMFRDRVNEIAAEMKQ